jgi:uncharacterized Ntn-hydrolase superfamily protein
LAPTYLAAFTDYHWIAAQAPTPPSSYAILARDPLTGEYGVAAASHAPLIGMNLEFLEPDVGGVVALGGPLIEVSQKILIALGDGLAPDRAVAIGLYGDTDHESRQILAISQAGAAAYGGKKLEKRAEHRTGEYFVAAGYHLTGKGVLAAMEEAFLANEGPLSDRLLLALEAGRDAGSEADIVHSAALLVVAPGSRMATRNRLTDLRIDFVPDDAVAALSTLRAQVDSVYEIVR